MVPLEFLVPQRKVLVMQEVVRHVVEDVAKDPTREHCCGHEPVPIEDGVRQLPEWRGQYDEQGWRHDQTILVHREVVMDAVKEEMSCDSNSVVGDISITRSAH